MKTVDCPGCGGSQPHETDDAIYWCSRCQCQFDADPDEGGDYSSRNPAARLEREERRREKALQRRSRR